MEMRRECEYYILQKKHLTKQREEIFTYRTGRHITVAEPTIHTSALEG
jgi:hypothetical protein